MASLALQFVGWAIRLGLVLAVGGMVAQAQERRPSPLSVVLFSALEIDSRSTFASSGGKLSLQQEPGVSLFILGAGGLSLSDVSQHRRGKLRRNAIAAEGRLLAGMERNIGPAFVSFGIGPSLAQYVSRHGLSRHRAGIAGQVDVWFRPSDNQVVHAVTILDSSQRSAWSRLRYGYRPDGWSANVGPEASYGLSRGAHKARIGLHASDIKLGRLNLTAATGALWEDRRPGAYLSVSGYVSF